MPGFLIQRPGDTHEHWVRHAVDGLPLGRGERPADRLSGNGHAQDSDSNPALRIPKRCKGVHCVDLGESFHMSI